MLKMDIMDGQLVGLSVRISLGNERDVALGLEKGRRPRADSAFFLAEGLAPAYEVFDNVLRIDYPEGTPSDNRVYFNLKGHGVGDIEDHNLTLDADYFIERNSPLEGFRRQKGRRKWPDAVGARSQGEVLALEVEGTPMDFREETPIGERIRTGYEPLVRRRGYDHIFLLRQEEEDGESGLFHAATLTDRARTLKMEVHTNFPALWFYSANGFSGREIGKGGCIYPPRGGVLLAPMEPPLGLEGGQPRPRDTSRPDQPSSHDASRPDKPSPRDVSRPARRPGRVEYRFFPIPQEFSRNVKGR